jgi:hypothetical protein
MTGANSGRTLKYSYNKKLIEDKIMEAEMLNLGSEVLLRTYVDVFKEI